MAGTIAESVRLPSAIATEKPSLPIRWWATLGAFVVALQLYVYTRWVFSKDFKRVDSGPDKIPLSMRVVAHSFEVLVITLMIWGLYRYVIKPLRTQGRLSPVGLMWASACTIYWLDWSTNWVVPIGNWTGAAWFNMGSWYSYIPGWVSPNGSRVAELNSFGFPVVIVWLGLGSMFMCTVMRKVKTRRLDISRAGLVMTAIGTAFVLDIICECILIRSGMYTYSASIPQLSLFANHYYQFPIFEAFLMAPMWGLMGSVLYFTDDKGQTWTERGLDKMRLSPRQAGVMRFLAFSGFLNLLMICYTLGWIFFTIQPGFQWTKDTVGKRSYLIQGICGPGTNVACATEGSPLPRGSRGLTQYVDPEGNVIDHGKVVGKVELKYK